MALKFEEPPTPKHGRGDTEAGAKAQELREHPQQWAIVYTYPNTSAGASTCGSLARNIRVAATTAWRPQGAFEAVSRKVGDEYRVYARYVAEPELAVVPEPELPVEPVRVRVVFDRATVTHIAQVRDGRVHTLCGLTAPEKALANSLRRTVCPACNRTAAA